MTSLPIALPDESEQSLRLAFRSFAAAAGGLQHSYGLLRSEVQRLHGELAQSRAGLALSLEENCEMRQHLDRILDGLPCGVLVMEADGSISRINPEGRRLLQCLAPGAAGSANSARDSAVSLAVPAGILELLSCARNQSAEQEECFQDKSGGEFWLAVRHAAVPREEIAQKEIAQQEIAQEEMSACASSIFILRDGSEAKRLLLEREKIRRDQALAEMSAILAHEIRNPLGSLELFAGLLAGARLSAECGRWVEQVQAGLRTLSATVNNVLHFHSLPAPQRTSIDMGELLDWAGGFLLPMARQAGVELRLHNGLRGIWLAADRHRLEQVLLNLALNALRATPEGGWVDLEGEICPADSRMLEMAVSDSGRGISGGDEEKLFEPGYSTGAGSPGLGLAVCRKIVEQHGGTIRAGSRTANTGLNGEGSGARFSIRFPTERNLEGEIQ